MTEPPKSGPHKLLLTVYAIFTLSAGARSGVQIARDFDAAPTAYTLSVLAAVTYALGWVAIRRAAAGRLGFATMMLGFELAGVLGVGTLSLARPDWFSDSSVWSRYGMDYGLVPAVLPILGLLWLRRQRALRHRPVPA
jgi:hypothetical protein